MVLYKPGSNLANRGKSNCDMLPVAHAGFELIPIACPSLTIDFKDDTKRSFDNDTFEVATKNVALVLVEFKIERIAGVFIDGPFSIVKAKMLV
ncbi:hypothetical protein O9G_003005 [Rozella allomycis CSF55]|uniref:Uncharacterized protein n=1 Tax=Rozella allomycis (strain CSF55) TaxID=988480 RepID=A0A075AVV8_ROZAC|nr:hypothetical protein O9G_003005 [Rozella allomycis CSF55]|eukprot:EPZ34285.1 hypothetical protein O9G_003005 [Rozella allomycis CSF55]